jgi:hypothetical protein
VAMIFAMTTSSSSPNIAVTSLRVRVLMAASHIGGQKAHRVARFEPQKNDSLAGAARPAQRAFRAMGDFALRKRGGIRLVPGDLAEVAKPISIDRVRQHLACVMVGLGASPTGETPHHEPHTAQPWAAQP